MGAARAFSRFKGTRVLLVAGCALLPAAAHGAFYIDDFEVGEVGSCNLESWVSFASNKDFMAVTSPSCVVRIGVPVEIGTEVQRARANNNWTTTGGVSGKVMLLPMTNGFGVGLSGQANWDFLTGASTGGNINVPVSFDLRHNLRLNLNGGWLHDGQTKLNYGTWGAGVEWGATETLAFITEIFGQAGVRGESNAITAPRLQTGVRVTPLSNLDVSLIYGRNLNGENAHWLTLGVSVQADAR
jgi:hypothetical protein